jgi:hypothetical protein
VPFLSDLFADVTVHVVAIIRAVIVDRHIDLVRAEHAADIVARRALRHTVRTIAIAPAIFGVALHQPADKVHRGRSPRCDLGNLSCDVVFEGQALALVFRQIGQVAVVAAFGFLERLVDLV